MFNGLSYNARCGVVEKNRLGGELMSVVASGFDVYADQAGEDADRYTITNLGHFMTMGLPFPSAFDILTATRGDRNGKNCNLR